MPSHDSLPVVSGASRVIGERALADIGELIAGLDQLDPLLALPNYPRTSEPGIPFGGFAMRARLGSGAHGTVFLAQDARLGRRVVVKVPQPVVLADPEARKGFVREARAAAVLKHPGIVPVFEAGEIGTLSYLVAGFIDGPSLARWLADRGRPLESKPAARLVAMLARSVHHAHERGILHCDLKPDNILMNGDRDLPEPVITDFGLARILTDDPSLTRTFLTAGTPRYMSPEQAHGNWRGLTARTDIYALGVILHELLTGRTPFDESSKADILNRVRSEPTPCVGSVNPDVARDLRAICRRCLQKDPQDRYASAAALADDLDRFLGGYPVEARKLHLLARAAKWFRRNPLGTAAAVVFAGLLTGFGLLVGEWWSARIRHAAELEGADSRRRDAEERAAVGEFIRTFETIRRRREERFPDWPTLNQAGFQSLTVPASDVDLASVRSEVAAALGGVDLGTPRVIAPGFKAYNAVFTPDGKTLALGSWHSDESGMCSVLLVDVATGKALRTLKYEADLEWQERHARQNGKPPGFYDGCRSMAFRPDGRYLVLGTRSGWLVRWRMLPRISCPTRWGVGAYDDTNVDRIDRLAFAVGLRYLVATDGRTLTSWDTSRAFQLTAHGQEPSLQLVRPARGGDQLWVKDMKNLRAATIGMKWLSAPKPVQFLGHGAVAAPGGQLLFGKQGDGATIRQFARYPVGVSNFEEYVAPFTMPGDRTTEDNGVDDLLASPDGQYLATSTEHSRHLKLWSVATSQLLSSRTLSGGSMRVAFSPDSRLLAICENDRTLLYPIVSSRVSSTQALQTYEILDAAVSQNQAAYLCRYRFNHADPNDHGIAQKCSLTGNPGWANTTIYGFNFRTAITSESRTTIDASGLSFAYSGDDSVVWCSHSWLGGSRAFPAKRVHDLQFGPNGRLWIAAESLTGWAADGSKCETPFTHQAGGIPPFPSRIAVGDSILLVGRSDGVVDCIDPNTGKVIDTYSLFDQKITAIALVGDGATAIAGSATGTVYRFNIQDGKIVTKLPTAHQDAIHSIAVGPRGWFATASQDRQVKIWTSAGQEVLTLPQSRPVRRVYWSNDGTRLMILNDSERGLKQWNIDRLKEHFEKLGIPSMLP